VPQGESVCAKIMLKQEEGILIRFNPVGSWSDAEI